MHFTKFLACLLACVLLFSCAGCTDVVNYEEKTEEDPLREFFKEEVSDETAKENIFAALKEVEIETRFISDFKKIEDGETGERYSFKYQNNLFIVSMDPDSTVYSVRVGEDGEDVYLKGYESYKAEDYFMTEGMENSFKVSMVNAVEVAFDDPGVYEFAEDWSFKREQDYYYTNVTVYIGEEKEEHFMDFTCYYDEPENTMYWYHLSVDGEEFPIPIDYEAIEIAERRKTSGE